MTIVLDRVIRMLRHDKYLPLKCYASSRQLSDKFNFCECIIQCKYHPTHHESKQTQDYQYLELEKDRISQK
jgi:hypothetical protein